MPLTKRKQCIWRHLWTLAETGASWPNHACSLMNSGNKQTNLCGLDREACLLNRDQQWKDPHTHTYSPAGPKRGRTEGGLSLSQWHELRQQSVCTSVVQCTFPDYIDWPAEVTFQQTIPTNVLLNTLQSLALIFFIKYTEWHGVRTAASLAAALDMQRLWWM